MRQVLQDPHLFEEDRHPEKLAHKMHEKQKSQIHDFDYSSSHHVPSYIEKSMILDSQSPTFNLDGHSRIHTNNE
jgi:hypothetical protein